MVRFYLEGLYVGVVVVLWFVLVGVVIFWVIDSVWAFFKAIWRATGG